MQPDILNYIGETQRIIAKTNLRSVIFQQSEAGLSGNNLLSSVRDRYKETKRSLELRAFLHKLSTELYLLDDEAYQLGLTIAEEIKNNLPTHGNIGVIFMGSAVTGGSIIRNIVTKNMPGERDLDWGLIADEKDVTKQNITLINDIVTSTIYKHRAQYPCATITKSCDTINGYLTQVINFKSVDHAHSVIADGSLDTNQDSWHPHHHLGLYLLPTFPQKICADNLKYLIQAINLISQNNSEFGQKIIKSICAQYVTHNCLKPKHCLPSGFTEKDHRVRKRVAIIQSQLHSFSQLKTALLNQILTTTI